MTGSITDLLTIVNTAYPGKKLVFNGHFVKIDPFQDMQGKNYEEKIPVPYSEREEREFARAYAPTTFRYGSGKIASCPANAEKDQCFVSIAL